MLLPRVFENDMLNDFFGSPFEFGYPERNSMMKTDVKENDKEYNLDIDLPGVDKDNLKIELKNGYLTVEATHNVKTDVKNDEGKYIRRERSSGTYSRSFHVGDAVKQSDIKAHFSNGVLNLTINKPDTKKLEEKKFIQIDG